MKRVLWISDAVTPTGFARVSHSIIKYLSGRKWNIHHLGINYYGDPHNFKHKIYPATIKGDIYGINRLPDFADSKIDLIFILNDAWIAAQYLKVIKLKFNPIPRIVVYFPVDGFAFDESWFKDFDIVSQTVVYTDFGYKVVKDIRPDIEPEIIPHGMDTEAFYPLPQGKEDVKKRVYGDNYQEDSFIILNANRNQPRKRLDISLEGFALFALDKPENVKYYHHGGVSDAGWNILKLAHRFGVDGRLIITNLDASVQRVPDAKLNYIYNATDIGLNTSLGEGWGLPNTEHAATGAPQIVSNNSASRELFEDCGLLIPISQYLTFERTLIVGSLVRPEDVADRLNLLYYNKELFNTLSEKCYQKFTSEKYSWKTIASQWETLFEKLCQ